MSIGIQAGKLECCCPSAKPQQSRVLIPKKQTARPDTASRVSNGLILFARDLREIKGSRSNGTIARVKENIANTFALINWKSISENINREKY